MSVRFSTRTAWNREENPFARSIAELRRSGRPIVDLTEGNPTRVGLGGGPELIAALGHPRAAAYEPAPLGHPRAREAVAGYYAGRGLFLDADRVVLSASTSESYAWIFKLLCERGDRVLIPEPSYPLFSFLADLEDVALVGYSLDSRSGWRVDADAVARLVDERTRAVVLVHPNNPTGSFVRESDAEGLEHLCAQRGLALIVDEVFGDYAHAALDGATRASFLGDRGALTFVLSGLSKIVAMPQAKLGWIAVQGDERLVEEALARLAVIADTYLSVSTPVQLALPEILAARPGIQARIRARIAQNIVALDAALEGGPCRRVPAQGGWYAIVDVPRTRDEDAWVDRLMALDGIIVHPGYFFDMPEPGCLVVSLLPEVELFGRAVHAFAARLAAG